MQRRRGCWGRPDRRRRGDPAWRVQEESGVLARAGTGRATPPHASCLPACLRCGRARRAGGTRKRPPLPASSQRRLSHPRILPPSPPPRSPATPSLRSCLTGSSRGQAQPSPCRCHGTRRQAPHSPGRDSLCQGLPQTATLPLSPRAGHAKAPLPGTGRRRPRAASLPGRRLRHHPLYTGWCLRAQLPARRRLRTAAAAAAEERSVRGARRGRAILVHGARALASSRRSERRRRRGAWAAIGGRLSNFPPAEGCGG